MSNPAKQKPSGVLVLPSVTATIPDPLPSAIVAIGGASLVACSYADAGSSTQQVLQFLDHMKNAVDDREGNQFHWFNSLGCVHFCWLIFHIFI
jgi:hypothetical protein